ncbi:MAG TPA: UDP-N-acetylglucosamine 2-epimerase [Edaphobacter sp.]|nr:UDP-N-acetylglucosamine 2-epimerase [Edaphobacter sp.]
MRIIGVVTTSRADYGSYRPLLEGIRNDPELRLRVLVSGMHLSPECGLTVKEIEKDGYEIAERIETLLSSDTPEAISKSVGLGVIGFAQVFSRWRPDILIVLGDRFEMHAAALAALPFKIPIAHISGGELTEGAIDDVLRHSLTKLSHLHFPATEEYRRRIIQLGEEPWRVVTSGEPSLDNLRTLTSLTRRELEDRYSLQISVPFLLMTYHPVTLEYEQTEWQIVELLTALREVGLPVIFTLPNADTGNHIIREKICQFVSESPSSSLVDSFGTHAYFSLMSLATAMVGNSSSGIVEAASFHLPVVNIGTRQQGRVRARNVIDVGNHREEIRAGTMTAIGPEIRSTFADLVNPYGAGNACPIIIRHLKGAPLGDALIRKKFHDLPLNRRETP